MTPHRPKLTAALGTWSGTRHCDSIRELNERCMNVLAGLARENDTSAMPLVVNTHRDLWLNLDSAAKRRASEFPLLLIDARLTDVAWWRTIRDGSDRSTGVSAHKPLPDPAATELAQELIHVAQQIARVDVVAAQVLLGLSAPVGEILATVGMADMAQVARRISNRMQPRWSHCNTFWRNLLFAAHNNDPLLMTEVQLHGLQLLGSDFVTKAA